MFDCIQCETICSNLFLCNPRNGNDNRIYLKQTVPYEVSFVGFTDCHYCQLDTPIQYSTVLFGYRSLRPMYVLTFLKLEHCQIQLTYYLLLPVRTDFSSDLIFYSFITMYLKPRG